MKRLTKKKRIIIILTAVIALAVAIPVSVKNIRSYVQYADSFGCDTMQEAVERDLSSHGLENILRVEYPRKALEYKYGKKWWESGEFLEYEDYIMADIKKYGRTSEIRNIEIASAEKITNMIFFEENSEYEEIYDAGLKVESGFELRVNYEFRKRYDYDVNGEDVATAGSGELIYEPVGEWTEWKTRHNQTYVAYKIAGKWYCRYWGE